MSVWGNINAAWRGLFYGDTVADDYGPEYGPMGADVDWAIRPAVVNSAFVACLQQLVRGIAQGKLQVTFRDELFDQPHPILPLWDVALIGPMLQRLYTSTEGFVLLRKMRQAGSVGGLKVLTEDIREEGNDYVTAVSNERISRRDVIPITLTPVPWRALAYVIGTDLEFEVWQRQLVRNNATPGLLVSPKEGNLTGDEQTALGRMFSRWRRQRGGPVGFSRALSVTEFALDARRLGTREARILLEERISADMGVPAIIAGLGAGLDRSTFANFAEARKVFVEGTVSYLAQVIAGALTEYLMPEWGGDSDEWAVRFDYTDHPAMQEDQRLREQRLLQEVITGVRTVEEWREMHNLGPLPETGPEDGPPDEDDPDDEEPDDARRRPPPRRRPPGSAR